MAVGRVYKWKAGPSLEAQMWCENVVSGGRMKLNGSTQTCTPRCAIYIYIYNMLGFFLAG